MTLKPSGSASSHRSTLSKRATGTTKDTKRHEENQDTFFTTHLDKNPAGTTKT